MIEVQAPNNYLQLLGTYPSVFLAGSIEMNTAELWQQRVIKECKDTDILFLNPRRSDWDSSITQRASDPRFAEQVNWELDGLWHADTVVFYFDPATKSPITLMELGNVLATQTISGPRSWQHSIVCCPDGFWRKGNVEILCERHNVPVLNTLEEVIAELQDL